ncbi:MAG: 16S rRNA (uracil(1498)-N(3))-methyltransferase [Acidimicrobiales bacterium]|nr:16S rRNA (uracil(1498)-N(3))-methyltransferase [Acidimicrobiales bacterium]
MAAAGGRGPRPERPLPTTLAAGSAHVFVEDLASPSLAAEDAHHLGRVLRLHDGEPVSACDGRGSWRWCRWREPGLEVVGPVLHQAAAAPTLTVGFCVPKGDRPEWIVQKLTELGIDRIVPLHAERSVVRWGSDRAGRNVERLRRVAHEAAMQSRRLHLPEVTALMAVGEADRLPDVALAAPGGGLLDLAHPTVLVGPEGGWSPGELADGAPTVGLGAAVLRVETAAIAVGALLTALRDGRVRPAS